MSLDEQTIFIQFIKNLQNREEQKSNIFCWMAEVSTLPKNQGIIYNFARKLKPSEALSILEKLLPNVTNEAFKSKIRERIVKLKAIDAPKKNPVSQVRKALVEIAFAYNSAIDQKKAEPQVEYTRIMKQYTEKIRGVFNEEMTINTFKAIEAVYGRGNKVDDKCKDDC